MHFGFFIKSGLNKANRGFTLIELLVVIGIIGVFVSVVLIALQSSRDKAKLTSSLMFSTSMYRGWGANALGVWSFDEDSGDAKDIGGRNINLTCSGSCNRNTSVKPTSSGKSLDFSSTASQAVNTNFLDSGSINHSLSSGYTVSLWVYPSASDFAGIAFMIYDRLAYVNFISATPSFFRVGPRTASEMIGMAVNYSMPVGKWTHLAYSYDGTNTVRVYINGKIFKTGNVGVPQLGSNATRVTVGNEGVNNTHLMRAVIDEMAVYTEVLTASNIEHLYAQGLDRIRLAKSYNN